MQGYDEEAALRYISKSIQRKAFAALGPSIDGLIRQAQTLDMRYMREKDVLDAEGLSGEGFYDDDEAFEFIVEEIVKVRGLNEEGAVLVASLVDAYMSAQDAFLRREGLLE